MTLKLIEQIICSLYFISIVLLILKVGHLIKINWWLVSTPAIIGTIILSIVVGTFIHLLNNMG